MSSVSAPPVAKRDVPVNQADVEVVKRDSIASHECQEIVPVPTLVSDSTAQAAEDGTQGSVVGSQDSSMQTSSNGSSESVLSHLLQLNGVGKLAWQLSGSSSAALLVLFVAAWAAL